MPYEWKGVGVTNGRGKNWMFFSDSYNRPRNRRPHIGVEIQMNPEDLIMIDQGVKESGAKNRSEYVVKELIRLRRVEDGIAAILDNYYGQH